MTNTKQTNTAPAPQSAGDLVTDMPGPSSTACDDQVPRIVRTPASEDALAAAALAPLAALMLAALEKFDAAMRDASDHPDTSSDREALRVAVSDSRSVIAQARGQEGGAT